MTKQNYEELKNKIGTARVDELRHYWGNETEDEDTQEWREEITAADEQLLIEEWDNSYNAGILKLCEEILEAERAFKAVAK